MSTHEPPRIHSARDHEKTLALCVTLGSFGVHHFYVGRKISGSLLCLSTVLILVSFGWLGTAYLLSGHTLAGLACYLALMALIAIWPLIDFLLLLSGKFRDAQGLTLVPSEQKRR